MTAVRRLHARPERPQIRPVSNDPLASFLSRLEGVRNCGRGWTAKCPAHKDRTASLSITAADDGRVLLHCFAGCGPSDVVAAAGLQVADLFIRRPTSEMSFAERAALKEQSRQAQWRAALNTLPLEIKIVQIAAHQLRTGRPLSEEDRARLAQATSLIDHAQEVLCGKRY